MTIRMSRSRWGTAAAIASVATLTAVVLAATPVQKSTVITPSSAGKVLRRDDIARVAREQKNAVVSLHTLRRGPGTRTTPRLWVEPLKEGLGSGFLIDASGSSSQTRTSSTGRM